MLPFLLNLGGPALKTLSSVLRKKVSVSTVLLVLCLLGAAIYAFKEHDRANSSEELAGWMVQVNDSTQAKIARKELDRRNALSEAAKALHGKVVASVTIHTKPDTIFVPVTEVITSTVSPDSTRTAILEDSTTHKGYKMKITSVAPPYPANLRIGYELTTPAFNPTIGFIKTGSSYAATVMWADMKFTLDDALFIPAERREPNWKLTGEAGLAYNLDDPNKFDPLRTAVTLSYNSVGVSSYTDVTMKNKGVMLKYTKTFWSH
jgi:hypothetical protein